ncbi:hypothetical protein AAE478_002473 [Parahypoxylon ruwenzoriense]
MSSHRRPEFKRSIIPPPTDISLTIGPRQCPRELILRTFRYFFYDAYYANSSRDLFEISVSLRNRLFGYVYVNWFLLRELTSPLTDAEIDTDFSFGEFMEVSYGPGQSHQENRKHAGEPDTRPRARRQ